MKNKTLLTLLLSTGVLALIILTLWQYSAVDSLTDLETGSTQIGSDAATTTDIDDFETPYKTTTTSGGAPLFVSKEYGFQFQYPEGFTVSAFDDRGGHVVLVRSEQKADALQVYITSWDEGANALTPSRIKQDLPNLTIRQPKKLSMSGNNYALTFLGEDQQFGTTREVWFVNGNHLYQILTSAKNQDFLSRVLETWSFR